MTSAHAGMLHDISTCWHVSGRMRQLCHWALFSNSMPRREMELTCDMLSMSHQC
ncbi:rCG32981 [Rattus norvegicus]|uniref:RCG32981 n=1 Tax=Rattus norvegicus TaxID=10116 RepID=A6HK84_RAT|nr:rCG32981 [Rattus norvegicus]